MSAKLSAKLRKALLNELLAHERYIAAFSMKAIQQRHGVSRQTLSRLRAELLSGKVPPAVRKRALEAKCRAAESDDRIVPRSNSNMMTDAQVQEKLAELERRADAFDRRSVEVGEETVALLDLAARKLNTTRDFVATSALRRWLIHNGYLTVSDPTSHAN